METKVPKLLPLLLSDGLEPLYNLPPTYKEGAKKVVLVKDIIHYDGRMGYRAGTAGVIIPIRQTNLARLFEEVHMFYEHYHEWKKWGGYYKCRTDCTYDFFPFFKDKKGKIRPSQYHTYISFTDFRYL